MRYANNIVAEVLVCRTKILYNQNHYFPFCFLLFNFAAICGFVKSEELGPSPWKRNR